VSGPAADADNDHLTKAILKKGLKAAVLKGSICDKRVHGCSCIVNDANTEVQFGGGVSETVGLAAGAQRDAINQRAALLIEQLHRGVQQWRDDAAAAAAAAAAVPVAAVDAAAAAAAGRKACPRGASCRDLVQKKLWNKLSKKLKAQLQCSKGQHTREDFDAAAKVREGGAPKAAAAADAAAAAAGAGAGESKPKGKKDSKGNAKADKPKLQKNPKKSELKAKGKQPKQVCVTCDV